MTQDGPASGAESYEVDRLKRLSDSGIRIALRGDSVTRRLWSNAVREVEVESRVFGVSVLCRLRGRESSVSEYKDARRACIVSINNRGALKTNRVVPVGVEECTSPMDSSNCVRGLVDGIAGALEVCVATALDCVEVGWVLISTVADSRLGDSPRRVGRLSSAVFS